MSHFQQSGAENEETAKGNGQEAIEMLDSGSALQEK